MELAVQTRDCVDFVARSESHFLRSRMIAEVGKLITDPINILD
jgi:hypothetical protein